MYSCQNLRNIYTYWELFRRRRSFWWGNALRRQCRRLQWRHALVSVDDPVTHRSKSYLNLQYLFVYDNSISVADTMWYAPLSAVRRAVCVKACPHCRRKVRQSPNFAVVSPFSATVALFCESVDRALGYRTGINQESRAVAGKPHDAAII